MMMANLKRAWEEFRQAKHEHSYTYSAEAIRHGHIVQEYLREQEKEMIKSCGSCQHWVKWKHNSKGLNKKFKSGGLCELYDGRCSSDHVCKSWKGIKYKRET